MADGEKTPRSTSIAATAPRRLGHLATGRAGGDFSTGTVAAVASDGEQHDVTCPHCHKAFSATALGGGAHRGFKCPHCRLFVPFERVEEQKLAESPGT
jgi:phage FluMu protein Com